MDQLGSDMLVDSDYDEKQQDAVAVISTPDDSMDEAEQLPRADDFDAMKERWMPPLPDLEIQAEEVHTWEIEGWRTLPKRTHGPVFQAGGHPWRILFFPAGNNASESVSFYLEQGFEAEQVPDNWYACVQFMLVLWNPNDPTMYLHHEANHRFTVEEGDWGFTRFAEKNRIFATKFDDKERPLVENDSAKITAYVRVIKDPTGVLWHNFNNYDSKKETGMVGMRNQGATCYLNSLLQSLYFTNAFRRAVYQIPTEQEQDPKNSSAWALQRLFYRLQTDPIAVGTAELTQSFGWESRQIFEQQDVQELSRILMEKMEEKMKGTEAENALAQMFVGKMKTYLKCINVDYESSRIEDFWDLQLNVSGCKTLDDSFKNYVEVETLEGDNKYHAEGFGLQDAKKGVIFESFPQVLHLQLKRFEYDFQRDMMVKVNDRYEFPEVWDAAPYLSETADKSEPYVYHLHGVLVHSGDMNAGHYYAFIKPTKEGDFYKFDDDRVTRATKREAMEENFGGDYGPNVNGGGMKMQNPFSRTWSTKRSMSAYMLVYIRESRLEKILSASDEIQPPEHLPTRLAEEKALLEKRRKEREEAHLYMNVQVATNDNFKAWQGFDIVQWENQDEEDPSAPKPMRVLKAMTVADFVKLYAEENGEDAETLRPWVVVNRQNGTKRPDQPISPLNMTLEDAALKHANRQAYFKLWLEKKEKSADGTISWDSDAQVNGNAEKKQIVIFLKHFDVEKQELKGAGHVYMNQNDKVADLAKPILNMMGWEAGTTNLKLFEEIKPNFVETMKPKQTLTQSEIQDGDIICFQKHYSEDEIQAIQQKSPSAYLEAPSFYDYLLNRITVHFAPKPTAPQNINIEPEDNFRFSLYLSKKDSYDNLAVKVAEHLSKASSTPVDPTHLRFTTINVQSQRPRAIVKRSPTVNMTSILFGAAGGYASYGYTNQSQDSLYYEVLEMSLADLEQRKIVKVLWLPDGINKEEPHDILVPKQGTISDVLPILGKKASIEQDVLSRVRFLEAHSGKIHRIIPPTYAVASINEFCTVYAEPIPEEEADITDDSAARQISAFHYEKDPSKTHNIPFVFLLKEGEIFTETKERLSKRTGIKGKAFEKIKFAVIRGGQAYAKPAYIDDEDVLSEKMQSDDQLGLEHVNKNRNTWAQHERLNIR
ncbi:hypothetical protein BDZ85DRAFT_241274 [Elsinoe ampelina]|uniref:ubiquitinyl hydrolase 1 n=1 Tax=Elsinoe ampelina TaxID=302913 RepID=A0A6A6G4L4_9PEZI|nr:hypothetical protein BDZ85DRAFT_241274 [Elsinoe ampelina]